jgi:hypothetical protein
MTHESIVPNSACPRSAASRTPSTCSRIQRSFDDEKYGRGREAGQLAQLSAVRGHRLDIAISARVLPDDGVAPRTAGPWIPDDGRLTLVGDTDRRKVASGQPRGAKRSRDHLVDARRDFVRIVLDPPGLREDLLVFQLPAGDFTPLGIEGHEAGAGGALVDRSYVHGRA